MLLKEQFHIIYKGVSFSCSPQAFLRNVRFLQKRYKLPRGQAMAVAYALLSWACERMASDVRAKMSSTEKKVEEVARSFMTAQELKEAMIYKKFIEEEESAMDPLREIMEIDVLLRREKTLAEQRPDVESIVGAMETDLKKSVLVGLAHIMRSMGYEKWPRDPEGRAEIQRVIDIVSHELVRMGRRFNSLLRDQLRVLKRMGPKRYEMIIRRWLAGQPEEIEFTEEEIHYKSPDEPEKEIYYKSPDEPEKEEPKKVDEQEIPDKVKEDWWRSASFNEKVAALVKLGGMSHAEASISAKGSWWRLPGAVRASLETGVVLAVEKSQ